MKKNPARNDIHDQKLLIVILADGTKNTVYNKREAARLAASQGRWVGAEETFFSRMKRAFQHGGTLANLGFGITVEKTDIPAKHRSAQSNAVRRVYAALKYDCTTVRAFPSGVLGEPPDRMICRSGDPNFHGTRL